jgi:predicted dehydrogenase
MGPILISGLGSIGRRHLTNLLTLGAKDIILHRTSPAPVDEAPDLPVYKNLQEALQLNPEVVIVSNPTAFHMKTTMEAVNAGCHVFIEKPLSHSWAGVEELEVMVKKRNPIVMMGFDMRFDPGLQKVKTLLDEGVIGPVVSVQAQVGQYLPDWHPHEDYRQGVSARQDTGGGVILDLIHEIDYVTWLIGPVAEMMCFADHVSSLDIETEDVAEIVLKFHSGVLGTIHLDYIQRSPSRFCRIVGEEGTIVWDYFEQKVSWFKVGKEHWEEWTYPEAMRNDRFLNEMTHLLACLEGRESPLADFSVGKTTLKLALAAKKSAEKNAICKIV